jgi:hypothetical protein
MKIMLHCRKIQPRIGDTAGPGGDGEAWRLYNLVLFTQPAKKTCLLN